MTKNTGIVKPSFNVLTTLAAVREKIKALAVITDAPLKTSGKFSFNPSRHNTDSTDITTCTNLEYLVSIFGFLTAKEREYTAAATLLNLTSVPVFKWNGYTYDSWKHDIGIRVAIINSTNNMAALRKAEAELSGMMTQEDRLSQILEGLGLTQETTEG